MNDHSSSWLWASIKIQRNHGIWVLAQLMYGPLYQRPSLDLETPLWHSCDCQETFSSRQLKYLELTHMRAFAESQIESHLRDKSNFGSMDQLAQSAQFYFLKDDLN